MSARSEAIAGLAGAPWALLHPEDAGRLGVGEGDTLVLTSTHGSIALRAVVRPALLPGQVFVPRGFDAAPVNALVDATGPASRVRVELLAAVAGAAGGTGSGA